MTRKYAFELFLKLSNMQKNEDERILQYEEEIKKVFTKIEKAVYDRQNRLEKEITELKSYKNRTVFTGHEQKFPNGCKSCLTGNGLGAVRKTNKCNLNCKFCYYYGELDVQPAIVDDMWEIGGTIYYEDDVKTLLEIQDPPSGIAYVYLEPFLEIEKYYSLISLFSGAGIYQHLYTNGTLATDENLKKLGQAGLNEIRFNLGASHCSPQVIENMQIAKKYIKSVGIETPMTREFYSEFLENSEAILNTGIDFINCAELHLNEQNILNYKGESLYVARQGYVSPIFSRELTLKLMKQATDQKWDILIHDCSNHTKFMRHINAANKDVLPFGSSTYSSEFTELPLDAFLPTIKDESIKFDDD